ncbi:MAG: caspase family protein [Thermodesulfobacteriota bacterium]
MFRAAVLAALLFAVLSAGAAWGEEEQRLALVIGNGSYESGPLRNAVNDAEDMARALSDLGFTVIKSLDADRTRMREDIRVFGDRLKKGGVGLFYYAGHGLQVNGENYLVPLGARVQREDEVEDECLMVSAVLRKMETAGNRLNIIILDACRDNPFARSFRSSQQGLARMDAPTGSLLAYATAPGSVASDGSGRNGVYTSMLLKLMKVPDLEILDLFRQVRVGVMAETGDRQVPWESTSLTGRFYFLPPGGPGTLAASAPPAAGPPAAAPVDPAALVGVWRDEYQEDGQDLYEQWTFQPDGTGFTEGEEPGEKWWAARIFWTLSGDLLTIKESDTENHYRVISVSESELELEDVSEKIKGDLTSLTRVAESRSELPAVDASEKRLLGVWRETWGEDEQSNYNLYVFLDQGQGREEGRQGNETWSEDFKWRVEGGSLYLEVGGEAREYKIRKLTDDYMDLQGVSENVLGNGFRVRKEK